MDTSSSSVDSQHRKPKRAHWGPNCNNCRRKKVRCPRGDPICSSCRQKPDLAMTCVYDKKPSKAYERYMLSRQRRDSLNLHHHHQTAHEWQEQAMSSSISPVAMARDGASSSSTSLPSASPLQMSMGEATSKTSPSWFVGASVASTSSQISPLEDGLRAMIEISAPGGASCSTGQVVQHEMRDDSNNNNNSLVEHSSSTSSSSSSSLAYSETVIKAQEQLADLFGIPRYHIRRLLHLAFTWIQPSFQIFDVGLLLQACAKATSLLTLPPVASVILTHADRFLGPLDRRSIQEQKWSIAIREQSSTLLGRHVVSSPPNYDLIEAFMQQAACDVGAGRPYQTWLHSGISIRMASEIGLFHPNSTLSHEELHRQSRLFWALYSFDKAISVYLGRIPSITAVPGHFEQHHHVPSSIFSSSTPLLVPCPQNLEHDNNLPFRWEISESNGGTSFDAVCNQQLCILMQKVNDVLHYLYHPSDQVARMHGRLLDAKEVGSQLPERQTQQQDVAVNRIAQELRDWWAFVPAPLKFNSRHLAARQALPGNVINLNIWYHTLTIILRRPELIRNEAHSMADHICMTAATEIGSIIYHCINTTGADRLGFGSAYGLYTAATAVTDPLTRLVTSRIVVQRSALEIAYSEPGLQLGFFIDCLIKLKPTMPGIEKSFFMLTKHIVKVLGKEIAGYIFASHGQRVTIPEDEGAGGGAGGDGSGGGDATEASMADDDVIATTSLHDQEAIDALFSLNGKSTRPSSSSFSIDQFLSSQDFTTDDNSNHFTLPIFPGTFFQLTNSDYNTLDDSVRL